MEEEIEVGEWIRSKDGFIGKVQKINYDNMEKSNYYICEKDNVMASNYLENIVKHSKNIIDLVEVGDIVHIKDVLHEDITYIWSEDYLKALKEDIQNGIKLVSIVTHEQFENIEYKV